MTTPLSIRPYQSGDMDTVRALWDACDLTRPWNDPKTDIAFCCNNPTSELFVGMIDHTVAASIMVGHDGHRGWVYYLATTPDMQRRGIGRKMLAHAEGWLGNLGVGKLNLMIRGGNEAVQAFYTAAGYKTEPRIVMAKHLKDEKS